MRIEITHAAQGDLSAAFRFLAERSPNAGRRVRSAIRRAILGLAQFPNRGRHGVVPDTRELLVPGAPYVLVYVVGEDALTVLRVRHVRQDPSP